MAAKDEKQADPSGVQTAIDRYRDLAKYLITAFASVGALLVAGTQLASLGKLTWDDDRDRLIVAGIALAVALAAVIWLISTALKVLRPIEMSLEDVEADADLRSDIESRPSLLGGAPSITSLRETWQSPLLDDDERAAWKPFVSAITGRASFVRAKKAFDDALVYLMAGAAVGATAIAVFAWAANPPDDPAGADPVMTPAPVELSFTLTEDGQATLEEALGADCVKGPISALSVGGKEGAPRVVTLPTAACKAVQFVLTPELGAPVSKTKAPSR